MADPRNEAQDEQGQQNGAPDQRNQLGQHQDKQAYQGKKQNEEPANPGRDRDPESAKLAQEEEEAHQDDREALEGEIDKAEQPDKRLQGQPDRYQDSERQSTDNRIDQPDQNQSQEQASQNRQRD